MAQCTICGGESDNLRVIIDCGVEQSVCGACLDDVLNHDKKARRLLDKICELHHVTAIVKSADGIKVVAGK